ncbi:UTRA domain-containing protein [Streptomyces sp. Lzd4kr]|uniref:GntR family transcriptional regulator n=1 Tax=Streptomyces sp. Y7 TaxID=3342392 RepID=UPI0022B38C17|nr:UTRA domain-containing protein [Streptomyces sp. Lzd4kr]
MFIKLAREHGERLIKPAGGYRGSRPTKGVAVPSRMWESDSVAYLTPRGAGESDAWSQELERHQRRGSQQIVDVRELEPPPSIAAALGLKAGETAVVRRRIMHLDDQPVELTDSYYPATIARGTPLAEGRKIPGGAVTLVAKLGFTISEVSEDVTVDMPSREVRETLRLDEGEPVLVLTRTSVTADQQPVEVSQMTMLRGHRLTYRTKVG